MNFGKQIMSCLIEAKQHEFTNAINLKKEEVKKPENSWDSDEDQW